MRRFTSWKKTKNPTTWRGSWW